VWLRTISGSENPEQKVSSVSFTHRKSKELTPITLAEELVAA